MSRRFAFNSLEYSLGLLTNEGKVKAQGQVFKELANAYRGQPVRYPKEALRLHARERGMLHENGCRTGWDGVGSRLGEGKNTVELPAGGQRILLRGSFWVSGPGLAFFTGARPPKWP